MFSVLQKPQVEPEVHCRSPESKKESNTSGMLPKVDRHKEQPGRHPIDFEKRYYTSSMAQVMEEEADII
jgi:hypothetical protein